jgi:uncharacterized membrane protein YcjF (UPF0283 family)
MYAPAPAGGLLLALSATTYLVAAKAHGRQLRLERELAGYQHVTFGGRNPAWVEALWRRERFIYWSAAAATALVMIAWRALSPATSQRSWIGVVAFHVVVPLTTAFVAAGLLSLARFGIAARDTSRPANTPSPAWVNSAAWGSAAWWSLTFALGAALFVFALS